MKNKKKGTSKKTWVIDCRTDSAFNFALRVLKEAENKKYPLDLRCNFAKIAYSNSCETIAKAQTNPIEFKLESALKLFDRNLKQIFAICTKLEKEKESLRCYEPSKSQYIIENPFDYIDINFKELENCFSQTQGGMNAVYDVVERYHYPRIIVKPADTFKPSKLMPTNDIIVYLTTAASKVFSYSEYSDVRYDTPVNSYKNLEFITYLTKPAEIGEVIVPPMPELVKFPEDSFSTIEMLLKAASNNPELIEEIRFTGYRLGKNNPMIEDIITATKNKINCKLYLELTARGEIDQDMQYICDLLNRADHDYLEVRFHYNGIKVHAKMIYIKVKDKPAIGILSTGNYNPETSRIYKDYHYISCEPHVTKMIHQNFNIIWNSDQPVLFSISNVLTKEIYEELMKGKEGKIWIQTNHLDNVFVVKYLKEAMKRGCEVKLLVRTTKGFHSKEFKNCKTVVGKYLEHARVYIFGDEKNRRVYLSSSDILFRNLYNRFESYVKITDPSIQKELVEDFRDLYKNGQK